MNPPFSRTLRSYAPTLLLTLASATLSLGLPSRCSAAFYVSGGESVGGHQFTVFGTLDIKTGLFTQISTTTPSLNGLGFASNGTLYGTTSTSNGNNDFLVINSVTGTTTDNGSIGTTFGVAAQGSTLYGLDNTSKPNLSKINPGSPASTTVIGSTNASAYATPGALTFGPGNTLYALLNYQGSGYTRRTYLDALDPMTGKATVIGDTGQYNVFAPVSDGGILYAFSGADIYTLNTTNGSAKWSNISAHDSNGNYVSVDAAAFQPTASPTAVPEPTSLSLFSLGLTVLLGYGWRRGRQPAS